ncbi:MAG: RecX family transcriptional regulator [Anaerolineae bacterium]|nr:RecX family transcriptional regulator [Anaerolineae bacterium]
MSGTITALEVQKRNKERVNVYLDGEYAFSLAMIEAAHLHQGQALSADDIAALQARDAVERAVESAVRFLSYRARSIHEVRQNLTKKDFSPATIDEAIARLERLGYLSDLAFARMWTGNRDAFNPKGPLALRQELRQKGVPQPIIEQALGELDFSDAAYRAAHKQATRLRDQDSRVFKQKLYQFLARRGFKSDTVRDVIARLVDELAIPDPDEFDYDNIS